MKDLLRHMAGCTGDSCNVRHCATSRSPVREALEDEYYGDTKRKLSFRGEQFGNTRRKLKF